MVTKDSHCMNMNVKIERKRLCVNLVRLAMSHNTQVMKVIQKGFSWWAWWSRHVIFLTWSQENTHARMGPMKVEHSLKVTWSVGLQFPMNNRAFSPFHIKFASPKFGHYDPKNGNVMWQIHGNWEWNTHVMDISSVKSFPFVETTSEKLSLITKQNPAACHDRSMTTKIHTEI